MKVTAFLPCRKGSERIKNKNTLSFAQIPGGLTQIKITQLMNCTRLDEIVVSTDDEQVMDIVSRAVEGTQKKLRIEKRPAELASSATSTDDLIQHVGELIDEGHVLWTHVTSPFIEASDYDAYIDHYLTAFASGEHDSSMAVQRIQTFLWSKDGPVNYDPIVEKWPRTQTLPLWYEVNSAFFLAPAETYREKENRIGDRPLMEEMMFPKYIDIDIEEQMRFAEWVWNYEKKEIC